MTLTKVGVFTGNLENINFDNISDAIQCGVMRLGLQVACKETFKRMWYWITLTMVTGDGACPLTAFHTAVAGLTV